MTQQIEEYDKIRAYIQDFLGIPEGLDEIDVKQDSSDLPFTPDLMLMKADVVYIAEIKSKVTIDVISRLNLLRDLWLRNKPAEKIQLVIAAKYFPQREEDLMEQLDMQAIKLPWSFKSESREQYTPTNQRITSEKSWKVISCLLKEKITSIRQLSLIENVSYGWTHKTIRTLMQQNIVKQNNNHVSISDVNKLLNGVAWERPLSNLKIAEIRIKFDEAITAAKEITAAFKSQDDMPLGFTSYTAASLYTGYGVRHDAVYVYMKTEHLGYLKELFESSSKKGVLALIYQPDRKIFQNTREIESIRIVSPAQTLLDLAGMGYCAMDMTKQMVSDYDTI
ncbi:hypothetical protein [uncultured Methanomethylovorans sp.]|uniref:hypothetical protein n=1 Tax=uncultured Methanomethylovorans sp. TaxID=183759 RepID=UPI002AA783A2|nr:hypothetical protein [uncultured Methanomethylovorans sp.]